MKLAKASFVIPINLSTAYSNEKPFGICYNF